MTYLLQHLISRKWVYIAGFVFLPLGFIQAQERCGIVEYTKKLRSLNLLRESDDQFEQWLTEKIQSKKQSFDQGRTQTTTYKIPVVVHVIHNGEALGVGANISDAQILSQMQVLNDDFQRLNADAVNTPAEFLSVAGSMNIQFILAKQAPDGSSTNGIVRVNGLKASWVSTEDSQLKALSYWPAEDYFNIWICNLTDFLGYTQFPVSTLPGLENSSTNRLTDGIVIAYNCFGTVDAGAFTLAPKYNKGRTLTHEAGHFLGLRHIWGDESNCTGTDYVNDTPNQNSNTNGCPTNPAANGCTPTAHKMFQNFLDYTDDACMNVFTKGQVSRMSTVLENSIRRNTLLISHGLNDPTPVLNDLGIQEILSPSPNSCVSTVTPSIRVQNYGSNLITTATIQLQIKTTIVETKIVPFNLNKLESTVVNFSPQVQSDGNFTFQFKILTTNSTTDGNPLNNTSIINTLFSTPIATPFQQNFNTLPTNWVVQNPDQLKTWQLQTAPLSTATNTAMYLNYFDYQDNTGTPDVLISPPFNLVSGTKAFLSFDVAYATFQNTSNDELRVLMLSDCNTDTNFGTEIYSKSGMKLATTTTTSLSFKPKNASDWRKEIVDISNYIGQSNLRIAFIGVNDYGNNIYVDNVSIITTSFIDLAITSINNPSFVSCSEPEPKIVVQNIGTQDIVSFSIQSKVNLQDPVIVPINNLPLKSGESRELMLPSITLDDGSNTISFTVSDPNNGGTDMNSLNNTKTVNVIANPVSKVVPLRENFDSGFGEGWFSINPSKGMKWDLKEGTNYKASAYFNAFNDTTIDEEAWLISPMLDFSHASQASVFFDQSYAWNDSRPMSEELKILASVGCGNAFKLLLYDSGDVKLSNTTSAQSWSPMQPSDWKREYVRLDSLVGKKDVRLAFVVTNGNGNNLYVDNIEFYTSYNKTPLVITDEFAVLKESGDPYDFLIHFTLPEQQTVYLDIFDTMGRTVLSNTLSYVLNQDYFVTVSDVVATGIYIVHLRTDKDHYTRKVLITR